MAEAVSKEKWDEIAAENLGALATPRQPSAAREAINAILKDRRLDQLGKKR